MSELIRVAAINDISGSGRCSLTAAMPILGAFGVQCCALPTAILTNHTGYEKYSFDDYTDKMENFIDDWKAYDMDFKCIYTGFLGSDRQIDIAEKFFLEFKGKEAKVLVDPVMGDDGKIYSTYTDELCRKMKRLVQYADVVTPNVTEAAILSDAEYSGDNITTEQARNMAESIRSLGADNVIITGIKRDGNAINYILCADGEYEYSSPMTPVYFSGTGDVFASLLCGFIATGRELNEGVAFATEFIRKAAAYSCEMGLTYLEGICFEKFLKEICLL